MPIPKPRKGENHSEFMDRCAGDKVMNNDYPDTKQRVAVCYDAWRSEHGNSGVGAPPKKSVEMKWMPTQLEVKGLNEGERTLLGTATTRNVDLMGDVVESSGALYSEPPNIPLLWMHNHTMPVGVVDRLHKSDDSIRFQARIAKVSEDGALKTRTDEAWQTLRAGLIKGVFLGF